MNREQLKTMLTLQDQLNKRVNPDWLLARNDWGMAIMAESVELADHLGWKWWKDQKPNIEQASMELVDIWHFLLAAVLESEQGNIDAAAEAILTHTRMHEPELRTVDIPLNRCGFALAASVFDSMSRTMAAFSVVRRVLGLEWDSLYEMYVGKNVLNMFRQDHGYKEGTYVKVWGGREDNEVLSDFIKSMPDATPEQLNNLLEAAYPS